jgi:hypothetical protein
MRTKINDPPLALTCLLGDKIKDRVISVASVT